jgi:hypothetical protein
MAVNAAGALVHVAALSPSGEEARKPPPRARATAGNEMAASASIIKSDRIKTVPLVVTTTIILL